MLSKEMAGSPVYWAFAGGGGGAQIVRDGSSGVLGVDQDLRGELE